MTDKSAPDISLEEAASQFLARLTTEEREISQPELYKFIRWFGREQALNRLSAREVAGYAERLSLSDTDYGRKLDQLRAFLTHARKAGWSRTNLAVHLKAKKAKAGSSSAVRQGLPEVIELTRQGYAELENELQALKSRRPELIEQIRRAAADKDFKENAPLAAAREQRGHLEGRIRELEETLKSARVINEQPKTELKVSIGDHLMLQDLVSGEELRYQVVNPREVDPAQGKISSVSPLGKVLIGRGEGEVVEVAVPVGRLRYQVKRIEH
ncbi:MAG TPA: transcription elongation factor GreA [Dehalococcoidia bacterium]|nr:transcription elongation factor GreA [Dehalococcoidia bacterium]